MYVVFALPHVIDAVRHGFPGPVVLFCYMYGCCGIVFLKVQQRQGLSRSHNTPALADSCRPARAVIVFYLFITGKFLRHTAVVQPTPSPSTVFSICWSNTRSMQLPPGFPKKIIKETDRMVRVTPTHSCLWYFLGRDRYLFGFFFSVFCFFYYYYFVGRRHTH